MVAVYLLIQIQALLTFLAVAQNSPSAMMIELLIPCPCQQCDDPEYPRQRNILSLSISHDLITWKLVHTLMADDTGLTPEDSARLTGFQYVDWQFDGDDIIYLVRTAYRGAIRYHDSNRIIFRVLKDYPALINKTD